MGDLKLPPFDDPDAIRVELRQVLDALLSSPIDSKRARQILYGLQIALRNVVRSRIPWQAELMQLMTECGESNGLAPKLDLCNPNDDCNACQYAEACPNYDPDNEEDDLDVDDESRSNIR